MWYLDCYHKGAACGDRFPAASYGPADKFAVIALQQRIGGSFTKTEITQATKGQSPTPEDRWPRSY